MFESLSAAYYLGVFDVETYDGKHGVVSLHIHNELRDNFYKNDSLPLLLKLGKLYLPAVGLSKMPNDTIGVPRTLAEDRNIESGKSKEVLVVKEDHAKKLYRL